MKSYKLTGLHRFELFEVPEPQLVNADDVLIRVSRVGVCGSDMHYYTDGKIGSQIVAYPWCIGHEAAGTVVRSGPAVRGLQSGARVAFDPALSCGACPQCQSGRRNTCWKLRFLGCPGQIEGCLSEYFVLPRRNCLPLPDSMSFEEGAMIEPLSIAVYAASLHARLPGATVAVFGAGPIGLCMLQTALAMGAARVYVTDKIDSRLELAGRRGAHWVGNPTSRDIVSELRHAANAPPDIVFECCGQQEALDQAVELLVPGGDLALIGIPEPNRISFDINLLRRKELRIQNVRRQNECMERALSLIALGKVDVNELITHRYTFAQTPEAFDLVANYRDGVVKAMINVE